MNTLRSSNSLSRRNVSGYRNSVVLLVVVTVCLMAGGCSAFNPVTLTTTSSVNTASVRDVHNFLASPENWPKITTSSNSVVIPEDAKKSFDLGKPTPVNGLVKEIFGLPPILAPSVTWKCVQSNAKVGRLEFFSEEGLPGVLSDARILYDIKGDGEATSVKLDVSFEPTSPFGVLASIALKVENTIAMKFLLPKEISKKA
mmetsp:Transcript_5225/g.7149  ORF Transcript_5225/g.7149 Transcript_5225/m.7149 type:complete len:200 (-) Transcript_5225:80-679(-)